MCEGKRFNPLKREEYYQEKGVWYRNIFEPTGYMKLKGKSKKETTAIFRLIYHLVNNDEERFLYVINWLSYFFKRLKKSHVALLLIGDQGAGKGILFEQILSELFGKDACIQANNSSLNTKFKAGIIENRLIYNFDEISSSKNSNIKNYLKAIIANSSITEEAKNQTMTDPLELRGQVLLT